MNRVTINLADLDSTNGFVINGIAPGDRSGFSVSNAGDVNGDGISDLIVGALNADPNGNSRAGESYVIFGGHDLGSEGSFELSALDSNNGFVINGINQIDYSGSSVSNAGDLNNDGIDDLIIGSSSASPNSNSEAGESYVVFGSSNILADFGSIIGTERHYAIEGSVNSDNIVALGGNDTSLVMTLFVVELGMIVFSTIIVAIASLGIMAMIPYVVKQTMKLLNRALGRITS